MKQKRSFVTGLGRRTLPLPPQPEVPKYRLWLQQIRHHPLSALWNLRVVLIGGLGLAASLSGLFSYLRPSISIDFPSSEPWGPGSGVFTVRHTGSVAVTVMGISCLRTSFDGGYGPYAYLPQVVENKFYLMSWSVTYTPQTLQPGGTVGTSCIVLDDLGLYAADVSIEFEIYYKTSPLNPFMWHQTKEILPWYPVKGVRHFSQKFSAHKNGNDVNWNFGSRDPGLFQIMKMKNRPFLVLMKERNDRFEFQP